MNDGYQLDKSFDLKIQNNASCGHGMRVIIAKLHSEMEQDN
jgi:hypothetical protein